MRAAAALLSLLLLLAGCSRPGGDGGSGGTGDGNPPPLQLDPFDGDAAHAFVAGLVTNDDGSPRFRVPGTPGHASAAAWLADQMVVDGWEADGHDFTGADYTPLDKGAVGGYAHCTDEESQRLAGLTFHNLWAIHRADPPSDRLVLLGAHWESKRFASSDPDPALRDEPVLGANDGASGVGVLLQLMRHVQEHDLDLPFDLGVVAFDGEDGFEDCHPLAGSLYFVSQLEPGAVDRFLLLDMVGDDAARFVREGYSNACDPALVDLLHDLADDADLAANLPGLNRTVFDDHLPFIEAGIPAVDLIDYGRGFPPYWHTTRDTMENISPSMLGRVGDLILLALTHEDFVDAWPATCQA